MNNLQHFGFVIIIVLILSHFSVALNLPFGEIVDGGVQEKFLYTGKEKDTSGLYYYGARYYDPLLKRFTQADTVIPDMYDPQSLNRFSYVRNNPYTYVDRDGHVWDVFLDAGFIGWDLYNILEDPTDLTNWAALGADAVFMAVPFFTGGGLLVKGMSKAGKSLGVAEKGVSVGGKAGKGISGVDKGIDVVKSFKDTAINKLGKEEWVNVDELYTRQTFIIPEKAEGIANAIKTEKGQLNLPPIEIVEINGRKIISNGNHRWQGTIKADKNKIKAIYVDATKEANKWDGSLEQFYRKSHKGNYYEK